MQKATLARSYMGWAGFQEANCELAEYIKVFWGTEQGKAQKQPSLVGWSNFNLDGLDGLCEEKIKDGGSVTGQ